MSSTRPRRATLLLGAILATGTDRLRRTFGASSDLARQIAAGAPVDVFFSADPACVDDLERVGLVSHGEFGATVMVAGNIPARRTP